MKTIRNKTGSKVVNISTDATGAVKAQYVQIYYGEEQVLQSKIFATIARAEKWAYKILN
jgi:hypothetical protein